MGQAQELRWALASQPVTGERRANQELGQGRSALAAGMIVPASGTPRRRNIGWSMPKKEQADSRLEYRQPRRPERTSWRAGHVQVHPCGLGALCLSTLAVVAWYGLLEVSISMADICFVTQALIQPAAAAANTFSTIWMMTITTL